MNYKKELGNVIREHRTKKKLSQEKLAEKCAMSTHQISDISLNRNEVRKLVDLCNTHSLSPEHLQDIIQDFLSV